ncbi:MAG: DNA-binding response regulator [Deltaproteobacteria bacterium]|nr:MAG: DNA-binding response regulator [Deltaproteobacteria bacterium]
MNPWVLIVDDDAEFGRLLARRIEARHRNLRCQVCSSPTDALEVLSEDYALLLVDLDMPELDGAEFLEAAVAAGVPRSRIVIHSSHTAEDLHARFDLGECLAVINKLDRAQQAALDLILAEVDRRAAQS